MDFFFFCLLQRWRKLLPISCAFQRKNNFFGARTFGSCGLKGWRNPFFDHPKNPKTPSTIGVILRTLYTHPCYKQVQTNPSIGGSFGVWKTQSHSRATWNPKTTKWWNVIRHDDHSFKFRIVCSSKQFSSNFRFPVVFLCHFCYVLKVKTWMLEYIIPKKIGSLEKHGLYHIQDSQTVRSIGYHISEYLKEAEECSRGQPYLQLLGLEIKVGTVCGLWAQFFS